MYISDIIKIEEMRAWSKGELIFIKAGTGQGKSYLIKNKLYALAKRQNKKILYLVNRNKLYDQIENELISDNKMDCIELMTYQKLEIIALYNPVTGLLDGGDYFKRFGYIVCDEYHYFATDASFNANTDLSLKTILSLNDKIRIFMSATPNVIMSYLKSKQTLMNIYETPYNYSNINKLYFTRKDDVIERYISLMSKDERAIYFCRSIDRALSLQNTFPNSLFICSQNNAKSKHMDVEKVNGMLENERFNEQILFTTSALDNGVNIRDKSIKHIIVDIEDFDTMLQCIGRKRTDDKDKNDKYSLIIRMQTNKQLGGRKTQLNNKIEMAEFLEWGNDSAKFIEKYPRKNYGTLIYDSPHSLNNGSTVKVVNDVMMFKCKYDIQLLEELLAYERVDKNDKKTGYIDYVLKLLGKEDFSMLEDVYDEMTVNDYFDSLVGTKLFKEEQDNFKKWIQNNLINSPKPNHGLIGIGTINGFLSENKYDYIIKSKKEYRRNENRNKKYWIISKITNVV